MYVKKLRRKCNVRGCKCTESYAISQTREMGNSIIACKGCLEEALKKIEESERLAFKEATPIATPTEAHTEPTGGILEPFFVTATTDDAPEEESPKIAPIKRRRGNDN